jgi:hypothetical protein
MAWEWLQGWALVITVMKFSVLEKMRNFLTASRLSADHGVLVRVSARLDNDILHTDTGYFCK